MCMEWFLSPFAEVVDVVWEQQILEEWKLISMKQRHKQQMKQITAMVGGKCFPDNN